MTFVACANNLQLVCWGVARQNFYLINGNFSTMPRCGMSRSFAFEAFRIVDSEATSSAYNMAYDCFCVNNDEDRRMCMAKMVERGR